MNLISFAAHFIPPTGTNQVKKHALLTSSEKKVLCSGKEDTCQTSVCSLSPPPPDALPAAVLSIGRTGGSCPVDSPPSSPSWWAVLLSSSIWSGRDAIWADLSWSATRGGLHRARQPSWTRTDSVAVFGTASWLIHPTHEYVHENLFPGKPAKIENSEKERRTSLLRFVTFLRIAWQQLVLLDDGHHVCVCAGTRCRGVAAIVIWKRRTPAVFFCDLRWAYLVLWTL